MIMKRKALLFLLVFFVCSRVSSFAALIGEGDPLKIFPNPAEERLTLELCSELSTLPVIHVIDLTGKVVEKFDRLFSFEDEVYTGELDISHMKPGVYFVKVIQGETVYSKKLMVQ